MLFITPPPAVPIAGVFGDVWIQRHKNGQGYQNCANRSGTNAWTTHNQEDFSFMACEKNLPRGVWYGGVGLTVKRGLGLFGGTFTLSTAGIYTLTGGFAFTV